MPRQRTHDCSSRILPLLTTNTCFSMSRFVRGLDFLMGSASGISCAAEFLHRADAAFRFIRQANNGTKIDKRGIETRRVALGDKLRGIRPEFFAADCRIDRGAHVEQSGQNTRAIRFDDRDRLIESKGCDCVCDIAANARQFANRSEYHQARSRGADPAQSWQRHEGFAPGCNSRVPARRGGRRFAKRDETDAKSGNRRSHLL